MAFANLVDEASGPRPEHAPPRTPYDRRLPWPGADTFHNGLFVPRSDDIPMTTFAAATDKAQGFAPDSDLSSQARSEASILRQSSTSTLRVAVESLWATCVRVSNKIFGGADGRRHHSSRDSTSNIGSDSSSNGNNNSIINASRYLVMPPSPQLPSASSLSSAEMATLRRASPQPELYCGKPVPTNKGKNIRKKRKGQQDGLGDDDDDEDEKDDRGLGGDTRSGGNRKRKRALRGGSEQFTPQIASKAPVHGLVAEAFIAYERPGKNGAHLFRVDLDVQNRGLLTVNSTCAKCTFTCDLLSF